MGCHGLIDMVSVGLAISTDGINWVKNSSPVMTANSQYYIIGLTDIVKKDSTYMAYFNYRIESFRQHNNIGMATSIDGINWTMYSGNPILTATLPWEGGSIYYPTVIFENNQFKMVYSNAVLEIHLEWQYLVMVLILQNRLLHFLIIRTIKELC